MEWKKFTITTTEEAEDLICGLLDTLGYSGVQIEDLRPVTAEESGGLFGDVVPEQLPDDHVARLSFYTDGDADSAAVISAVMSGIEEMRSYVDVGDAVITESKTAEEDWINNWKAYFHAFRVEDIVICPTWEDCESLDTEGAAMVLRIDPGTAFGTGAHESTQIALRALRKYQKEGDRLLDIGTGSGILGIAALKRGAQSVFGTDLDDNTLPAIADNLRQNGIPEESFAYCIGNIADDPLIQERAGFLCYDIVCANIIAEILADITPEVPRHLKSGGYYITSGILHEREEIVREAGAKAGLREVETLRQGEWSGIVFQKP